MHRLTIAAPPYVDVIAGNEPVLVHNKDDIPLPAQVQGSEPASNK
jgi:hypothetical protein